jgi:hypothetical protein
VASNFSVPTAQRSSSAGRVAVSVIAVCWALTLAVNLGYLFLTTTHPGPNPGDDGATFLGPVWGPLWLQTLMFPWAVIAGLIAVIALIPLAVTGFLVLRKLPPRPDAWLAGWVGAVIVALALEAALLTRFGIPVYVPGRVTLEWADLVEAGGFLAVGATMISIIWMAPRGSVPIERYR